MEAEVIATDLAPRAIGPYSQALAAGDLVFCSGQIALDPRTGEMTGGDAGAQARQALGNLARVLEAAGSDLGRVLKTTLFLVDMGDFAAVNEVYAEAFGAHRPARSTVAVSALPKGARFEVEAIALRR
jgi:2-iminobutanoate/2-iminopropanoate deaminase